MRLYSDDCEALRDSIYIHISKPNSKDFVYYAIRCSRSKNNIFDESFEGFDTISVTMRIRKYKSTVDLAIIKEDTFQFDFVWVTYYTVQMFLGIAVFVYFYVDINNKFEI